MKYLIVIISILSMFFTQIVNVSAQNSIDQFEVQVDGLGCPFCAYGLEKKFKELKGIDEVVIEMETGVMTFSYPTDAMLTMETVENQVDAAGYTAVNVKVIRADGSEEFTKSIEAVEVSEDALVAETIEVQGNCGMCKARIEKAAKAVAGVTEADWNKKTKLLEVVFDSSLTSIGDIDSAVVMSGHDTQAGRADDNIYEALPGCCQYERVK